MKPAELTKLNGALADGGPLYSETNLNNFIVEPWNALSSLAFIAVVIYWVIRLKGRYKDYLFLTLCLPLLFFGGLGSTLFHAFRNSYYLLVLDVLPTAVLTLLVAIYFWTLILPKSRLVFFVIPPFFIARMIGFNILSSHDAINFSYFITGVMIFLPSIILLLRTNFRGLLILSVSCLLLISSLVCRQIDAWQSPYFHGGTHWLWHILSALGGAFLAEYLYRLKNEQLSLKI